MVQKAFPELLLTIHHYHRTDKHTENSTEPLFFPSSLFFFYLLVFLPSVASIYLAIFTIIFIPFIFNSIPTTSQHQRDRPSLCSAGLRKRKTSASSSIPRLCRRDFPIFIFHFPLERRITRSERTFHNEQLLKPENIIILGGEEGARGEGGRRSSEMNSNHSKEVNLLLRAELRPRVGYCLKFQRNFADKKTSGLALGECSSSI